MWFEIPLQESFRSYDVIFCLQVFERISQVSLIDLYPTLTLADVRFIIKEILNGLHYAHS